MGEARRSLKKRAAADTQKIRVKFDGLLAKTNNENPAPSDVKALAELLNGHESLELWRHVAKVIWLS